MIDIHKIIISNIFWAIDNLGSDNLLLVLLIKLCSLFLSGILNKIAVIIDSTFESLSYSLFSLIKLIINLIIIAIKVTTPAPIPKYPINPAIFSSFSSSGVWLFSWALSTVRRIIPF